MCGRYRLSRRKQFIADHFDASGEDDWEPRYNIAPTQPVPIIRGQLEKVRRLLRYNRDTHKPKSKEAIKRNE